MPVFSSLEALSTCSHFSVPASLTLEGPACSRRKGWKGVSSRRNMPNYCWSGVWKQPKSLSHRGIEMWTDRWMGRQFLIKQHRSRCLGQSWRRGWRVGRVAESCHRPGSQGPAAGTHHICSRVYTRHQGERERSTKACFARTAPGKTMKVTSLGSPLFPLIMEFMFGKNARGSPLSPSL